MAFWRYSSHPQLSVPFSSFLYTHSYVIITIINFETFSSPHKETTYALAVTFQFMFLKYKSIASFSLAKGDHIAPKLTIAHCKLHWHVTTNKEKAVPITHAFFHHLFSTWYNSYWKGSFRFRHTLYQQCTYLSGSNEIPMTKFTHALEQPAVRHPGFRDIEMWKMFTLESTVSNSACRVWSLLGYKTTDTDFTN